MERISYHQFMVASAAVLLGTTFIPIAQNAAEVAGRDGWWAVLPAFGLAIPWGLMILSLVGSHPGKNLLEISGQLLGKWPAKGVGLLYVVATGYLGILLLARVGDTFRRSILPLVPASVILGGVMILTIMLAWLGIEVFARFTEVTFPMTVAGLMVTAFLTIPRFEWEEFYPVLGNGLKPVLWGVAKMAPFSMEYILCLAGVLNYLPKGGNQKLKSGIWRSVLLVGVLNTIVTMDQLMVFGPVETARLNYGLLSLGKMVEISKTISGVESLFMLIWLGAEVNKIAILFFTSLWGIEMLIGRKNSRVIYLAAGAAFFWIALIQPEGTRLSLRISQLDEYLILPLGAVWIPLLLGVRALRRRIGT